MSILFVTSKAKKTTRGNTRARLFVTDKGFIYVEPMPKEADMMLAIKQLSKAVRVYDALICDAARSHKSKVVIGFCNDIDTALKRQRGTPIGPIKLSFIMA